MIDKPYTIGRSIASVIKLRRTPAARRPSAWAARSRDLPRIGKERPHSPDILSVREDSPDPEEISRTCLLAGTAHEYSHGRLSSPVPHADHLLLDPLIPGTLRSAVTLVRDRFEKLPQDALGRRHHELHLHRGRRSAKRQGSRQQRNQLHLHRGAPGGDGDDPDRRDVHIQLPLFGATPVCSEFRGSLGVGCHGSLASACTGGLGSRKDSPSPHRWWVLRVGRPGGEFRSCEQFFPGLSVPHSETVRGRGGFVLGSILSWASESTNASLPEARIVRFSPSLNAGLGGRP